MGESFSKSELKPKTWGGFWDIFGEKLVNFLDIQEGDKVLDLGTGGGAVLYPTVARVGDKGHVVGIEKCEHCVGATSGEIKRCGIETAQVQFNDVRETGLEAASFDCVTAGFLSWDEYFDFQSFEYKKNDEYMVEICRLLKLGGKFGMSSWLKQEDLDWIHEFLESHSIESKPNYHIEDERSWRFILSAAGFKDIQVNKRSVSYTYDSIDFWWKEMMDYDWPVDGKNSEVITDSIKKEAFNAIQSRVNENGGIPFTRDAIFATAILKDYTPSL